MNKPLLITPIYQQALFYLDSNKLKKEYFNIFTINTSQDIDKLLGVDKAACLFVGDVTLWSPELMERILYELKMKECFLLEEIK